MDILIVDDELDVKALFEQRFRREIRNGEFTLHFAHSGEDALVYFSEHQQEVILILSDINMPGMSGLVLLEKLRQLHPERPPAVMMLTAYGDKENHDEAMRLGANDFLVKPIDFSNLKDKLQKYRQND